jgi:hypothetical protein
MRIAVTGCVWALMAPWIVCQSVEGGASLSDAARAVVREKLPATEWRRNWMVYPDLLADGVVGTAMLYAGWCNERRLQLFLQSMDHGQIADTMSLDTVDERRFRCGVAYTPVWGVRSAALEAALAKRWLRHGNVEVEGTAELNRAGAAFWGGHDGFLVGFSPLSGGIAEEGVQITRWSNCAVLADAAETLEGGILGQCIWRGIVPPSGSELSSRYIDICRMPEWIAGGPVVTIVPGAWESLVVLAGEPAQWRALAASLDALRRVVGDLERSGSLVEVTVHREEFRKLRAQCLDWLEHAVTAVDRVLEALDAGQRRLDGDAHVDFWRAADHPPASLLRFRHARDRWAFGASVEIVDGAVHARLGAPRDESSPLGAPEPRRGFGHVGIEELIKRKAEGPRIRGWKGMYYVGSDATYHYFALCTDYVHRLAITRSDLQVQGAEEPSDDQTKWVDVSNRNLQAPVLELKKRR